MNANEKYIRSVAEWVKENWIWKPVAVWADEEFYRPLYDETHELPPYVGILNPISDKSFMLFPWVQRKYISGSEILATLIRSVTDSEAIKGLFSEETGARRYLEAESDGNKLIIPWKYVPMMGKTDLSRVF